MQTPLSPPASPNLEDTSSNSEFKVSDIPEIKIMFNTNLQREPKKSRYLQQYIY